MSNKEESAIINNGQLEYTIIIYYEDGTEHKLFARYPLDMPNINYIEAGNKADNSDHED